ncbi:MAG: DUF4340 domain-containing protein [Deltaproteobacteria bacterium]|nr:MAG: DUF4340 domain-containing protein [Deltaproteobacteria bacterium]
MHILFVRHRLPFVALMLFCWTASLPANANPSSRPTTTRTSHPATQPVGKATTTVQLKKPTTQRVSATTTPAKLPRSRPASRPTTRIAKKKPKPASPLFAFLKGKDTMTPHSLQKLLDGVEAINLRNPRRKGFVQLLSFGKQWRLTYPLIYNADQGVVKRFLTTLFQYRFRKVHKKLPRAVTAPLLKPFLLAEPPYHLILRYKRKSYHLTLAKKPNTKKQFYVYAYGTPGVLKVGRTLWHALDKTLYDWKAKLVFPTQHRLLTRIQMGCKNQHVLLQNVTPAKREPGTRIRWRAMEFRKKPFQASYRVNRLISMMSYVRYNKFISHLGKKVHSLYGLHTPDCVLQLNWATGSSDFYRFKVKDKYSVYVSPSHTSVVGLISEFFMEEMKKIIAVYHPTKKR